MATFLNAMPYVAVEESEVEVEVIAPDSIEFGQSAVLRFKIKNTTEAVKYVNVHVPDEPVRRTRSIPFTLSVTLFF